jgi:hypothetical protein
MTLDRFVQLLDTFGAEFRRWPAELRGEAEALRDASPHARERWEAARRLDALFRLERARAVDPARGTAVTDAALRRIRTLPEPGFGLRWLLARPVGAALAMAACAGIAIGLAVGPGAPPPHEGVPALVALLGDGMLGGEGLF